MVCSVDEFVLHGGRPQLTAFMLDALRKPIPFEAQVLDPRERTRGAEAGEDCPSASES